MAVKVKLTNFLSSRSLDRLDSANGMFRTVSETKRLLWNHFTRAQSALGLFMISKESAQSYSVCLKANIVQMTFGQAGYITKIEYILMMSSSFCIRGNTVQDQSFYLFSKATNL